MATGRVLLLAVGLLLAPLSGCRRASTGETQALPAEGEFTLSIVNHGRLDVVIYVVHGGVRDRVGESSAASTKVFKYRLRRLGAGRDFYLYGDPIGSITTSVRSETIVAEDKLTVTWTLENDLRRSTVQLH